MLSLECRKSSDITSKAVFFQPRLHFGSLAGLLQAAKSLTLSAVEC
jgi:hypothetical protein